MNTRPTHLHCQSLAADAAAAATAVVAVLLRVQRRACCRRQRQPSRMPRLSLLLQALLLG
jgi:hypothetical protein